VEIHATQYDTWQKQPVENAALDFERPPNQSNRRRREAATARKIAEREAKLHKKNEVVAEPLEEACRPRQQRRHERQRAAQPARCYTEPAWVEDGSAEVRPKGRPNETDRCPICFVMAGMLTAMGNCVVVGARCHIMVVRTTENLVQPGIPRNRNYPMQGQQQNGNALDEIAFHGNL